MSEDMKTPFSPDYETKELSPNTATSSPRVAAPHRRSRRSILATLIPLFTIILYVGVLVASMVALGYVADTNRDLRKINKEKHCILYSKPDGKTEGGLIIVLLSESHQCDFVIYGNATLGCLAVLLILLAIIKILLGRWLMTALIVNCCLLILGVLVSLSVGIILSDGLSQTCSKLEEATHTSCQQIYIVKDDDPDDPKVYFYTHLHRAEQTTWSVFGMLCLMLIIESVVFCILYIVRKKKKNSAVSYEALSHTVAV